jgi:hypothetical protein
MSYLVFDFEVSLSDNQNVNQATSLIKQDFLISPPLEVQTGKVWEDSISAAVRTTVVSTERTLAADGTTQLQILQPRAAETSTWRIRHAGGTNPVFRTARSIGLDATSSVRIQVLSSAIARIDTDAGTTLNTAAVVVGDTLLIERTTDAFTSPFATSGNTGVMVQVVGKGSGYVDVVHNNAFTAESAVLGVNFAEAIRIYSASPVQVNDILDIKAGFNYGNQKKVVVTLVRSDYIEFTADDMVAETVTGGTLKVYDRFVNFLSLKASGNCRVYVDSSPLDIVPVDASGAYLCVSLNATKVELENTGSTAITASCAYSTLSGSGC